jgi:hypothetical protein
LGWAGGGRKVEAKRAIGFRWSGCYNAVDRLAPSPTESLIRSMAGPAAGSVILTRVFRNFRFVVADCGVVLLYLKNPLWKSMKPQSPQAPENRVGSPFFGITQIML